MFSRPPFQLSKNNSLCPSKPLLRNEKPVVWGTDAEHSHDMPWLSRKAPGPTSEASKSSLHLLLHS